MHEPIRDLAYVVLPGNPGPGFDHKDLHRRAFQFWKLFWTRVLADVDPEARLNPVEFYRQDRIALLLFQDEIVALHGSSHFDLKHANSRPSPYLERYFPPTFFEQLRARNANRLMSIEYLSVDPRWRSSQHGVALARTIACLAMRQIIVSGFDAGIAAARCDVGVDKLSHEMGGQSIIRGLMVHDRPTDLVAFFAPDIRKPRDAGVAALVDALWTDRLDTTHVTGGDRLKSVA